MKKRILSFTTILMSVLLGIILASCTVDDVGALSTVIGSKEPNLTAKNKINKNMTALEMYQAGVRNFDEAAYAGSYQTSKTDTNTLGIEQSQSTLSRRVRSGEGMYIDSYTYSTKGPKISAMYEAIADASGYRLRKAKEVVIGEEINAKKWNDAVNYGSFSELSAAFPNDPVGMYMVKVNADTIIGMTEPEYDRKSKQYSFSFTLNPVLSTVDYVNVIRFMTSNNGIKNPEITFTGLKIDVVMWSNGYVRSIKAREEYDLKGTTGILKINGKCVSDMSMNFTYDENEMSFRSLAKF